MSASLREDAAVGCQPAVTRPVALIDGTEDPLVPFSGGEVRVLGAHRDHVIGAEATFSAFRGFAGCAGGDAEPALDRIADHGTVLVVRRDAGCRGGTGVVLHEVPGGGHAWPGAPRYARERLIGKVSQELDANCETWRYFRLPAGRRGAV